IGTELVANSVQATQNFPVNNSALSLLFGSVPLGQKNTLTENVGKAPVKTASAESRVSETVPPAGNNPKQGGVPGGQGIILKGGPAATPTPEAVVIPKEGTDQKSK